MRRKCLERFPHRRLQRKPPVSNPGMHHGTCVTHVPWCMSGSLTLGGGENVPGIPSACAPAILRIWYEAREIINLCLFLLGDATIWPIDQRQIRMNIVSRGKMEHRVFWKNHARGGSIFKSTWFLSSASSASWMEIKLAVDHVFSISQKRNFTVLIYQFTRVLTSSALTN